MTAGEMADDLESVPMMVEKLQEENFRAVRVAAGDSVSLAVDDRGEVRQWGSFRVYFPFHHEILVSLAQD